MPVLTISYLKKVFWPPAFFDGIGASFQVLEILMYSCGLKLGSAAIFDQNLFFEMASKEPWPLTLYLTPFTRPPFYADT